MTPDNLASFVFKGVGAGTGGDRAWVVMREQLRRYVSGEKIVFARDLNRGY